MRTNAAVKVLNDFTAQKESELAEIEREADEKVSRTRQCVSMRYLEQGIQDFNQRVMNLEAKTNAFIRLARHELAQLREDVATKKATDRRYKKKKVVK